MKSTGQRSFWQMVCAGSDAWSRAACRLRALAAQRGVCFDEQVLIFSDVHDLQTLEWQLTRGKHPSSRV
jgi:hypothetical protein